jgi:hypothetical protein
MTITSSLRFLYIFGGSGLLCAEGRSENPGVPLLFGGHNLPLLLEIGLTDLPKSGGATPWARVTKNVKKPQNQMCESCRKAKVKIFVKQK